MSDIGAIPIGEASYPSLLKQIKKAPVCLYIKGDTHLLSQPAIAIVGTRKATAQAGELAGRIAYELASAGLVIVSGLAQGIDGSAHQGALEAGGKTIAVLGSSLEEHLFFPLQHKQLAHDIVSSGGALVSEHQQNQPARKHHFILRNRIIAGLSLGVLVVQAPEKSGALITAQYAKQYGRLILAVPDSPFVYNAKGSNALIAKGAFLVQSASDVLDILAKEKLFALQAKKEQGTRATGTYSKEEALILGALKQGMSDIDKLSQGTKVEIAKLLSLLVMLEIKGVIKQAGGTYLLTNNLP